jgi:hypothetical protein
MVRFAHVLLIALSPTTIVGCRHCCVDDFGTSGYARIEGKVTRANGTALANSGVAFSCGPESPTAFGWTVPTDAAGRYFINIDAPGPVIIPASGALICRVSAPTDAPPVVSVERLVPFSASADTRPLTIIDLLEP